MIQAPRGTKDMLPQDSLLWQKIEAAFRETAALFGYRELRTPTFEHTELFSRGVGDTTDIVEKEMYTFLDKGGRSITLKPEGTAGAVRAVIENHLYAEGLPVKIYYLNNPIFRYENPQSGRLREHHQFGLECFGAPEPTVDAEQIFFLIHTLGQLGIENLTVNINSIGCPVCRPAYHEALKGYLYGHKDALCKVCQDRLERNPLRVLDCKETGCRAIAKDAPRILDHLCEDCQGHFDGLKNALSALGVSYEIDTGIVRGLDYYTKTVFEIIMHGEREGLALCGGGRYDNLSETIGGPKLCGVGFGIGTERIIMEMTRRGLVAAPDSPIKVYVAPISKGDVAEAARICAGLRLAGIAADSDHMGRSLKAQFKYADKVGARLLVMAGGDEAQRGAVKLRDLTTRQEQEIAMDDLTGAVTALLNSPA